MTSRRSSGSMRAESAVEPTRSENITVTWRRSAASWGCGSVRAQADGDAGRSTPVKLGNRRKHLAPMAERDAKLFEVLIGQIGKDGEIDVVLGKTLGVLGHAELFEPVRNLLHRGPHPGSIVAWTGATESLPRIIGYRYCSDSYRRNVASSLWLTIHLQIFEDTAESTL